MHASFLVVYLALLVGVGAWKARRIRTQEDFSLAGRGLSGWVLVGTLVATWIGTGSIFANAEKGYHDGLPALVLPLSSAAGILVLCFLAARIRRMEKFTIQDVLEERFGVGARIVGTIALLAGYLIIVSYQYRAGAAVLQRVQPSLTHDGAIAIAAAVVVAYTALAGLFSVAYTDVANGVLMLVGLVATLPYLLARAGGPEAVVESLPEHGRSVFGVYSSAHLVSILLPAFLLVLGEANMYQRFFAAKDERTARRSAFGMLAGVLAADWLILAVVFCGTALVAQGKLSPPENPAHLVVHLAFDALPSFLGALLCATIVAVIVSTADSFLLSPATAVVRDVYQRFLRPQASDAEMVLAGRAVVVGLGLVAFGLALLSDAFFGVALFAYTLYGAAITPPLLAAFFWPRATPAGAVGSMLAGLAGATLWQFWLGARASAWAAEAGFAGLAEFLHELDAALPAVVLSVGVLVALSLLTQPRALAQPT